MDAAMRRSANETPVLVFGQRELEAIVSRGGPAGRFAGYRLVSIGEPRPLWRRPDEDERMPPAFRGAFAGILRLGFSDCLSREPGAFGKRAPCMRDARRVIRFVEKTAGAAEGYAVHCWSGISRSAAVALGVMYMLRGDEGAAMSELLAVRPYAAPHRELLAYFDELLGSALSEAASSMGGSRLSVLRERIRSSIKSQDREP